GVSGANLANEAIYVGNVNVLSQPISVNLNFDNQGNPSGVGYLDYVSVEALRQLIFPNKQFQFKNSVVTSASGIGQYHINNASQISEVWDVTDTYNVTTAENLNASSTFNFTSPLGTLKNYVAVTPIDYFEPKDRKSVV